MRRSTTTLSSSTFRIHAFDSIIADECHRGYTGRGVASGETRSTISTRSRSASPPPRPPTRQAYFKDVVYRYEYERAVREGYLVDYDVVTIKSDVRMKGVFLKEGEQVEHRRPRDRRLSSSTSWKTSASSTHGGRTQRSRRPTRTARFSKRSGSTRDEHEEQYGRFPKTLIFAANDLPHTSHADRARRYRPSTSLAAGESFVRKITGARRRSSAAADPRVPQSARSRRSSSSVDLMSTGVDIPDLEFIVFLRPVKSRILFEQMLGRGTRKGEKFPTSPTSRSSTASTGRCSSISEGDGDHGRAAGQADPHDRRDHRRHLGQPGPRLQHPLSG